MVDVFFFVLFRSKLFQKYCRFVYPCRTTFQIKQVLHFTIDIIRVWKGYVKIFSTIFIRFKRFISTVLLFCHPLSTKPKYYLYEFLIICPKGRSFKTLKIGCCTPKLRVLVGQMTFTTRTAKGGCFNDLLSSFACRISIIIIIPYSPMNINTLSSRFVVLQHGRIRTEIARIWGRGFKSSMTILLE